MPSNEKAWPEGKSFYHYDQLYDEHNVGYAGPKFSYAPMPDQYTLSAFHRVGAGDAGPRAGDGRDRSGVLPHAVDAAAASGRLERRSATARSSTACRPQGKSRAEVWRDADQVQAAYGESIQYSLHTLISFVQTYHDDNLVLVVLGDHQPATIVSGTGADHDVPISIVAHDPAVLARISVVGLAGRPAARTRRRRSGRWTPSATGS